MAGVQVGKFCEKPPATCTYFFAKYPLTLALHPHDQTDREIPLKNRSTGISENQAATSVQVVSTAAARGVEASAATTTAARAAAEESAPAEALAVSNGCGFGLPWLYPQGSIQSHELTVLVISFSPKLSIR